MPRPDPFLLIGTTVDQKYLVEEVVGEGGFSVVYQATHVLWKRKVALKVFRVIGDLPAELREHLTRSFLQEGTLLADLSERCAAICQARDIGTLTTEGGEWLPYMVLEWLEGETLEQMLASEQARARPPRTLLEAVRFLDPAARALGVAHAQGIAHRDVKPANLFVLADASGRGQTLKVLDFGISKVVQEAKSAGAFERTGGVVTSFTPSYGAPEQYSRAIGATGPWTDVFALTLVLLEMFTDKRVLMGDDLAELLKITCSRKSRPTPRTQGFSVTDAVEAVFARALAVDPAERYSNADLFWNALNEALGLAPQSSVPMPATPALPAGNVMGETQPVLDPNAVRAPRRSGVAVLATVGVVAALSAAYVTLRSRKPAAQPAPIASVPAAALPLIVAVVPTCPSGMVKIDGGRFYMGSEDGLENERPPHKVTLAPYCIDVYEVTTEAYKACSDSGDCRRAGVVNIWDGITEKEHAAFDPQCNANSPALRARHPINCVEWEMARTYCGTHGGRLPTEAEWEFAARGPDGRKYPWGDDPPSSVRLNACGSECVAWGKKNHIDLTAMYTSNDGWETTAPVGSFPDGRSRYGLQDVVGNVWEWVDDWYGPYPKDDTVQKAGPSEGTARVIRGGAWNGSYADWVRPTFRYRDVPTKRSYGVGFRCAADVGQRRDG